MQETLDHLHGMLYSLRLDGQVNAALRTLYGVLLKIHSRSGDDLERAETTFREAKDVLMETGVWNASNVTSPHALTESLRALTARVAEAHNVQISNTQRQSHL